MQPAGIALLPPIVFTNGLIVDTFLSSASSSQNATTTLPQTNQHHHHHHHQLSSTTATASTMNPIDQSILDQVKKLEERKRSLTEQYLHIIEDSVDKFLSSKSVGVQLHAIPERYLDEPPQNMLVIRRNTDMLYNCSQDAFNPHSELITQVIAPLVQQIYTQFLDPLRQELYDFWMNKGLKFVEKNSQNEQKKKLISKCDGILQDIQHIDQMREIDSHSTAEVAEKFSSGGLSQVVPIAGLALGRIHRLLNEHQTVIQHWGSNNGHSSPQQNISGRSPSSSLMRRR